MLYRVAHLVAGWVDNTRHQFWQGRHLLISWWEFGRRDWASGQDDGTQKSNSSQPGPGPDGPPCRFEPKGGDRTLFGSTSHAQMLHAAEYKLKLMTRQVFNASLTLTAILQLCDKWDAVSFDTVPKWPVRNIERGSWDYVHARREGLTVADG